MIREANPQINPLFRGREYLNLLNSICESLELLHRIDGAGKNLSKLTGKNWSLSLSDPIRRWADGLSMFWGRNGFQNIDIVVVVPIDCSANTDNPSEWREGQSPNLNRARGSVGTRIAVALSGVKPC